MKNNVFLFVFVFMCFMGNSQIQNQDSVFMTNIWHLQKLEINNAMIPAPNSSELSYPKLYPQINNNHNYFLKEHCNPGSAQADFYFKNKTALFIRSYTISSWLCSDPTNENFITQLYDNEFILNNIKYDFQFEITDNGTHLEMVIIGENGNKAYYHNNLIMSLEDIIKDKITIYPNPVSDIIYLKGDDSLIEHIEEVLLYDVSGKCVLQNKRNSNNEINIKHLNSGSYILNFLFKGQLIKYGIVLKE